MVVAGSDPSVVCVVTVRPVGVPSVTAAEDSVVPPAMICSSAGSGVPSSRLTV